MNLKGVTVAGTEGGHTRQRPRPGPPKPGWPDRARPPEPSLEHAVARYAAAVDGALSLFFCSVLPYP